MYNRFLEQVLLPLGDKVLGSSFMSELKKLRKQDLLGEKALENLQKEKLKRLLDHAHKHSKFYAQLNIASENDPIEMLKSFPILTKETLRKNIDEILTVPEEILIEQRSSGSSGLQTIVYFSKAEQSIQQAQQIRWWEWAGYRLGDPILQTGITPNRGVVKQIKDFLLRTYYLPAFSHTEASATKALRWAASKSNPVLAGYASSLFVLATLTEEKDKSVSFKTAISWGDKLFEHYKEKIEDIFDTKVFNTYASSEGFMIAGQKDLEHMYIMSQHVYLEIIDDDGNEVPDGTLGHVVVTNLNNYSMPMIRYRLGDLAVKLPREKYPKKREYQYPLLQMVIGRDTDLVKTRSGKYMVVHSFTGIFEHFPEIKQYTVIQHNLNGIEIDYVPSEKFFPKALEEIERKILHYLDEKSFSIDFKKVDSIPPTPSGKPQIIQSFLKENR